VVIDSSKRVVRPFVEACWGRPTARPPIWLMRQAGRYLPEYRALRSEVSFEELCRTPDLAAEVTLQPIRRYNFDAAIIFSDILVVSDALGCPVRFPKGGPRVDEPIRSVAAVEALRVPPASESLGFVMEALNRVRVALPSTTALIGFAGAPLTVAAYMVEGGSSRNFENLKRMIYQEPACASALLGKISELTADYLAAQVAAGADVVQVFDTWASILPPADYATHVLPHLKDLFTSLAGLGVPTIYFAKGASHLYDSIRQIGAQVVGVDWSLTLDQARILLGDPRHPVQGNLDPVTLLCDAETVRRRARAVVESVSERSGYIFNLGHGVIKETDPEVVSALVDEVRRC
jgi:uroporphyrinogen decarboxylase